jgi:hypothetical protein
MYDEKVKKMLERKEWQQEPYKGLKVAGIDIWFWISIIYYILWGIFIAASIIRQDVLPQGTKLTLLMITFGAGVPLLVAACIVHFAKGVK